MHTTALCAYDSAVLGPIDGRKASPAAPQPKCGIVGQVIRSAIAREPGGSMSLLAGGRNLPWRGRGGLLLNAVMFAFFAGLATASIVYLLAPKWNEAPVPLDAPRLPVSVAGVIYNIAPAAIRVPLQRRTGAQDRV